jgi:TRAP-type C4-dicarboxylate transport system permease small subunit
MFQFILLIGNLILGGNQMKKIILQLFDWTEIISKWLTVLAACCIAIMMVIVFADIVGTKFFKVSIPGALDISEELMVFLTLLPLAYLAAQKGHINITLVESRLSPGPRFILDIIKYGIATVITGIITWRVYFGFLKAYQVMELKGGLNMPTWPANLVTVIAFGFLTLVWFLQLAKTLLSRSEGTVQAERLK